MVYGLWFMGGIISYKIYKNYEFCAWLDFGEG